MPKNRVEHPVKPLVTIVRVISWGQRGLPKPGTRLGYQLNCWAEYRKEYTYEATGIYIGFDLVALE